ncbi:hypothetical protein HK104_005992 [Borealophlyctis nickersoniae]|nr:hypothetical protein HK104_005992 [Borealophlyctis nickersoniae]
MFAAGAKTLTQATTPSRSPLRPTISTYRYPATIKTRTSAATRHHSTYPNNGSFPPFRHPSRLAQRYLHPDRQHARSQIRRFNQGKTQAAGTSQGQIIKVPSKEELITLNRMAVAETGSSYIGVLSEKMLESALSRPHFMLAYKPDSSIYDIAASLAFGLTKNHPFLDGNKRTAILATIYFLRENGIQYRGGTVSEECEKMVGLTTCDVSTEEFAVWLSGNLDPVERDSK